ncbi:MAG: SAM-dependent methyltransferase [Citrobacter freundii]|nr:MAG: SAM-dependent methyltransferase [Citrobacter freundii]
MISTVQQRGNNTSRFSNRATNYAKFRPGYPPEVFPFLETELQVDHDHVIVDIGSGTGLFAEPILARGYAVTGIEPNDDMRKAGDERLKAFSRFTSVNATAEQTGLDAASVDLITIAQTFHWLDPVATRRECHRILKPGGKVVLAWNRQKAATEFELKFDDMKEKYRIDERITEQVDHSLITTFFAPNKVFEKTFANTQLLDFEGLKGQLLSKSYIPLPGHERYDDMITELIQFFIQYNENGLVKIEYETLLIWGSMHR